MTKEQLQRANEIVREIRRLELLRDIRLDLSYVKIKDEHGEKDGRYLSDGDARYLEELIPKLISHEIDELEDELESM